MKKINYGETKEQLDEVLRKLQDPEIDIDEAVRLHSEGTKLLTQLEAYIAASSKQIDSLVADTEEE